MVDSINELRPRLMSVAYRMLGSVTDAEDAVQDAFLRLQAAERVTSPEGFLIRATTRRCIDQLRATKRRKTYVGPWVPEPIDTTGGMPNRELAGSLSQGFLLMLERLSPHERAAFLLRVVFDYEYAEIGEILDKSEVHVRQIVSRARSRLKQDRPRFDAPPEQAERIAERFVAACRSGDIQQVEALFADDVEVLSDGGGKVAAARVAIRGRSRAARFLVGVFSKKRRDCTIRPVMVNGSPGLVLQSEGAVVQVVSLRVDKDIRGVYMTLNPDKLAHWSAAHID